MKSTGKLFSILLITTLLSGFFLFNATSTAAIQNLWVELSSPKLSANSSYKFHLTIEKHLLITDWIQLIFPTGTVLKEVPYIPPPGNNPFRGVNPISEINYLPDGSIEIKCRTYIDLDPSKEGYRDIVVEIPFQFDVRENEKWHSYRIYNPSVPGEYYYYIATQREPDLIKSLPVWIEEDPISPPTWNYPISNPIVDLEPSSIKDPAGYSLDFDLNENCEMKAQKDSIKILFPKEVYFSKVASTIHRDWITINENNLLEDPLIQDQMLILPIPYDLPFGQHISIKIDSRVGICNPEKVGMYELTVLLSPQIEPTRSFPYFIGIVPSPALLLVEPSESTGNTEFKLLHKTSRPELKPLETIYVRFPDLIKLPYALPVNSIRVNGKPIFAVTVKDQIATITLRSYAKGWMPVMIQFGVNANIKTPTAETPYQLELKVQKEGEFIPTNLVK